MSINTQKKLEQDLAELKQEFDDFAYIVSHDLSGPLRHASSFAEMVLSNEGDNIGEKSKHHLGYIIESSEKGREALELLRDYSRLNTREFPFSSDVNLNEIVQDILAAHLDKIESTRGKVTVADLPDIKCAPQLIKRAFEYLLENGLTYYPKSETPNISIDYQESASHHIFIVKDKGLGIVENRTETIFKIFKRAVDQVEYPGNGMGLALAKKIAQKHGGDISVDTKLGEGSTFYLSVSKNL